PSEVGGEVEVPFGVQREARAEVVLPPPAAPGPEHVALGGVLHDEDVVVAGAGEGEVAERGHAEEVAGNVEVAGGVEGDPPADVTRGRVSLGATPALGPQPALGSSGEGNGEERREEGETEGCGYGKHGE